MKIDKNKFIIILVGFLDILAIGIIIPTLPDLANYYKVPLDLIAYWMTAYALAAFLATPVLWQLSDIYWRKKILNACVWWSFLSSLVIAFSTTYPIFLVWRIINWITWWNISILQAIIWDISKTKEERAANMWILGSLFWMAFVIWPLVWAFLLHFWVMVPYYFMAIFSFVEIIILMIFLKETNNHREFKKININPFTSIIKYLLKPKVSLFILSFLLLLLWFSIYQSILPLYLAKNYNLTWSQSWYFMAFTWILMILNQIFLIRQFWLKKFNLNQLLYIINISIFLVFLMLNVTNSFLTFIIIFTLIIPFQWIIDPVYQSEIMENTPKNERWETMWVMASIRSVSMFLWPVIWAFLLRFNLPVFLVSAFFVLISIIIMLEIQKHIKNN